MNTIMTSPSDKQWFVLGFTKDYYTLWSCYMSYSPNKVNGKTVGYYPTYQVHYKHNLSMDYNTAVEKMNNRFGSDWEEDLTLHGQTWKFTESDFIGTSITAFAFGKYQGFEIDTLDDFNYIHWYMGEAGIDSTTLSDSDLSAINFVKGGGRPKQKHHLVNAHKVDIYDYCKELLIKNNYLILHDGEYITQKQLDRIKSIEKQNQNSGHFFTEGERIETEVKLLKSFSFSGYYGTCFVDIMETTDGNIVKYKGSASLPIYEDSFTRIKGTVSHGEYKGTPETSLKRIKVLS